ncbi:hypothetical protein F4813DRAFT_112011 [Daldinia decipiens]|uniref:uncharacterized protein n=1 Tax=Daldinia decipiens TaxID=326647 RepID=UPI0020C3B680|nr:uncharacterized protein F4813DRAFT_112011 [Daldinia decipiens]KAI1656809.1 hypothetical protein F4813DRAFT_112011 [Daldinia decipiens]
MSEKHEYKPLMGEDISEEIQGLENQHPTNTAKVTKRSNRFNLVLIILIALSLSLNILQISLYKVLLSHNARCESGTWRTKYAGLKEGEIDVFWNQKGAYTDPDDDVRDRLWDSLDFDPGVVAVPKLWAVEKGLDEGATFPWDSSKSLYFVNAYHSLHCIKQVYRAFRDYRMGNPPSISNGHVVHCLDQLLADIKCQADDTLRATNVSTPHNSAVYQTHKCRNWDALEKWTQTYPSCYRYGNGTFEDNQPSQLPRFRFCQEGTPELEKARKYFGKGEDWKPIEEKKFSWFD